MALSPSVMLASVTRAADAAAAAVSDAEASPPVATAADGGEPRESFDALVNLLLEGACPAATAAPGLGDASPLSASEADCTTTQEDGAVPGTTDVVAELEAMAACLPASSAAASLPPGGNILPSTKPGSSGDAGVDGVRPAQPQVLTADAATFPVAAGLVPPTVADAVQVAQPPGVDSRLPTDAPATNTAVSNPSAAASASLAAPEMSTVGPSSEAAPRADQTPPLRAETSLPAEARTASGHQSAMPDDDTQGQARLQELLARLGASDDAGRASGETFRGLLQGADSTAVANSGALTYAQAGVTGPARDPVGPSLPVHTPLRHPEWSDEVSQRIRWAIGNQLQTAELKINPPQLGPVEVRVSVDADRQMTVTLASQHALVRETLTDNLPRLRELMSEHGFSAVNVDVSQHSSSDGRHHSAQLTADPSAHAAAEAGAERETETGSLPQPAVRGLVDLYA